MCGDFQRDAFRLWTKGQWCATKEQSLDLVEWWTFLGTKDDIDRHAAQPYCLARPISSCFLRSLLILILGFHSLSGVEWCFVGLRLADDSNTFQLIGSVLWE